MTSITIPAKNGGSFQAYISLPAILPAPAVIMVQEIFGVNAEMRQKCDDLASAGFIALAPDLFWRMEPGVQLTDKTESEWAKALDLMNRFDVDLGIEDLRATHHVLRGHADATGAVGCVGYCLGGKLAYLMATRTRIDAAISYYGVGLDALLDEARNLTKPLMLHIAEEDQFVSKAAQAKILAALSGNSRVTIHSYPGVNHAFSRIDGQHYDAKAAAAAKARSLEFLKNALAPAKAA